jgi:hypothetical protein
MMANDGVDRASIQVVVCAGSFFDSGWIACGF